MVDDPSTGEYRSIRAILPVDRTAEFDGRADDVNAATTAVEDANGEPTATAVGPATIGQAEMAEITDGILRTLAIALGAILVTLVGVYRLAQGSATLGAVTVVPIALMVGLVVGGMYVLDDLATEPRLTDVEPTTD